MSDRISVSIKQNAQCYLIILEKKNKSGWSIMSIIDNAKRYRILDKLELFFFQNNDIKFAICQNMAIEFNSKINLTD